MLHGRSKKKVSGVMEIFCVLFGVEILVVQVYIFIKMYLTLYLRYVHFTLCHFYLN